MHSLVGWAKALALNSTSRKPIVRRAHAVIIRNCARPRGHGARETLVCGTALPAPLPTLRFRASGSASPLPNLAQDLGRVLAEPRRGARRGHRLAANNDRRAHAGNL